MKLSLFLELLSFLWNFVADFLCWIIKKANEINCFRNMFFEKSLCRKAENHVRIAFLIVPILSKNKLFRMKKLSRFWIVVFADCSMTCFCSAPTPRKLASNHIAKANKFNDRFKQSNSLKLFDRKNVTELICAAKKQDQICSRMNCCVLNQNESKKPSGCFLLELCVQFFAYSSRLNLS